MGQVSRGLVDPFDDLYSLLRISAPDMPMKLAHFWLTGPCHLVAVLLGTTLSAASRAPKLVSISSTCLHGVSRQLAGGGGEAVI